MVSIDVWQHARRDPPQRGMTVCPIWAGAGPGRVLLACHDEDMEAVNLDAMLARFAEHWSPKKIAHEVEELA